MPIIYGNGFKPMALAKKDIAEKKKEATTSFLLDTLINVASAALFIGLSFIPVAGEAVAVAGETAIEAIVETSEAVAAGAEAFESATTTANILRLGQTVKGSIGLGLAEAGVNTGIDAWRGDLSILNESLNVALAFTPLLGISRGRKLANIRLVKQAEKKIVELEKLLSKTTGSARRIVIEERIRELKNIRMINSVKGIFSHNISSYDIGIMKQETLQIIEKYSKDANITVKNVAKDLKRNLAMRDFKVSKQEARRVIRSMKNQIPSLSEGLTVKAMIDSKKFRAATTVMRYADPSLATRKLFTNTAKFLSSDTNILVKTMDKQTNKWTYKWLHHTGENFKGKVLIGGKKFNIGYYKKFGKKLSKFWRNFGKKIYKHSSHSMIPVLSKWIAGYRMIETGIPGEYILVIMFKPSRNGRIPEPRVISPVSMARVMAFATGEGYGGSVGSYYINEIALARNGSNSIISAGLSSLLGPLPLGELRNLLAAPSAFERVIIKINKGQMGMDGIMEQIKETSSRLWAHKVGKVAAGRWGIAFARGMQYTKDGHTHTDFGQGFDYRHLIEEVGVVSLDKMRSVQRKSGIMGRTTIIGAKRLKTAWQRTVKLGTLGYAKYDSKVGFKKGKGIF